MVVMVVEVQGTVMAIACWHYPTCWPSRMSRDDGGEERIPLAQHLELVLVPMLIGARHPPSSLNARPRASLPSLLATSALTDWYGIFSFIITIHVFFLVIVVKWN